ncbi:hypothetical protein MtrunA17_Chr3g0086191 [Medicago truncatula]|uniref:Uncharacterized protein n=1 Tax=Medicago truncatula TaxID=3880 RepID=A0A396IQ39_MEDTR|nr:hypothetical protein MtrunA17_Chr3g0086191 [Medicago truncatula]
MILTRTREEADTVNFIYYNGLEKRSGEDHLLHNITKVRYLHFSYASMCNSQQIHSAKHCTNFLKWENMETSTATGNGHLDQKYVNDRVLCVMM